MYSASNEKKRSQHVDDHGRTCKDDSESDKAVSTTELDVPHTQDAQYDLAAGGLLFLILFLLAVLDRAKIALVVHALDTFLDGHGFA